MTDTRYSQTDIEAVFFVQRFGAKLSQGEMTPRQRNRAFWAEKHGLLKRRADTSQPPIPAENLMAAMHYELTDEGKRVAEMFGQLRREEVAP